MDLKKILELQPTELMVLITIILVVIGGANIYAYYNAIGLNFLIKDISMSMLIVSTFKYAAYLIIYLIISYVIFLVSYLFAFIVNILCSLIGYKNIKENSSKLWLLLASIPLFVFNGFLYYFNDILINYFYLVLLIFYTSLALIFKEINKKFSIEDINVVFFLLISCFAIGNFEAKRDIDISKSHLPKIEENSLTSKDDWRILMHINEKLVLINLNSKKEAFEYRVIKLEDVKFSSISKIKG